MATWILVAVVAFEFFFALDCYKKMLKAQKDFEGAQTMFAASVKILEDKEKDLLNATQLLKVKSVETNYLRKLLDDHGIDWESGWKRLS
jgi:hypothetical protein